MRTAKIVASLDYPSEPCGEGTEGEAFSQELIIHYFSISLSLSPSPGGAPGGILEEYLRCLWATLYLQLSW